MQTTWRNITLLPAALSVAYLVPLELLYFWFEKDLPTSGTGMWLGGVLLSLLSLPGWAIGGHRHTNFWVQYLGYGETPMTDFHRRAIGSQVPIITTAVLIYFVLVAAILLVSFVSERKLRR